MSKMDSVLSAKQIIADSVERIESLDLGWSTAPKTD